MNGDMDRACGVDAGFVGAWIRAVVNRARSGFSDEEEALDGFAEDFARSGADFAGPSNSSLQASRQRAALSAPGREASVPV